MEPKKGKLIVIDGVDFSGKETQTELATARLLAEGYPVRKITFPDYESEASALVKLYLGGSLGKEPDKIGAYPASTFFAVDRYVSFIDKWGADYHAGKIILSDRYTTSNMIHQAAKIADSVEHSRFIDWLKDLEYEKFGLPRPDGVIFLDMPPEQILHLRSVRAGEKDIHEQDEEYLARSHANACRTAESEDWHIVSCVDAGRLRTREEIHEEVYQKLLQLLSSEE